MLQIFMYLSKIHLNYYFIESIDFSAFSLNRFPIKFRRFTFLFFLFLGKQKGIEKSE